MVDAALQALSGTSSAGRNGARGAPVPALARSGPAGRRGHRRSGPGRPCPLPFGRASQGDVLPEKDTAGNRIDYEAAVSGGLQLVPSGFAREALADDYRAMLGDGMLPDDSEPFEALIERCAGIEARANELEADKG